MPLAAQVFLFLGAVNGALVVAAGAFGAHALKAQLTAEQSGWLQTAVQYHMFHAIGLLAVGVAAALRPGSAWLPWAGALMTAGIVLFSGSLYALALGGSRAWGAAAPFGGTALLVSWVLFALAFISPGAR